jgi:hypothetical protein
MVSVGDVLYPFFQSPLLKVLFLPIVDQLKSVYIPVLWLYLGFNVFTQCIQVLI